MSGLCREEEQKVQRDSRRSWCDCNGRSGIALAVAETPIELQEVGKLSHGIPRSESRARTGRGRPAPSGRFLNTRGVRGPTISSIGQRANVLRAGERSAEDRGCPGHYFGVTENDAVEAESATPRFPFDSVYKALCCHRRTLRDMLHGYLVEPHGPLRPELVTALDLDTLRKVSMEWVTRDFRLRRGDQVWQVAFTDAGRSRGYPAFLLVNLELQSRRDRRMALRFLEQGGELMRELHAQGAIRETGPCPVLSIVLYNGRPRWTAPTAAAALANMPPAFGAPPAVPAELGAFWPWGYWPLDFAEHAARSHIPGNVMSMIIGIEIAFARDPGVSRHLIPPLPTMDHRSPLALMGCSAPFIPSGLEGQNDGV